jgi:hypothetical protein
MAGGIIDLVCRGIEDLFISGDPQITMFKIVYRRYSNFSLDTKNLPLTGKLHLEGKIPQIGDLVGRVYLKAKLPELMAIYDDNTYDTINELLVENGIEPFTNPSDLTFANLQEKLDNEIEKIQKSINFYNQVITELTSYIDPSQILQDFDLINKILQIAQTWSTIDDDVYFIIYNTILSSTANKFETTIVGPITTIVGPYDLLNESDVTNYVASFKTQTANMLKGDSHIIITTNEIIKGLHHAIQYFLFGYDPSDFKFIYKFFNIGLTPATNLSFVTGASRLINVFNTLMKLKLSSKLVLPGVTLNEELILLDEPFYIRFDSYGISEAIGYNQLDLYKYLIYYLDLAGGDVVTALANMLVFVVNDTNIRNLLNTIIDTVGVRLYGVVLNHFLLNVNTFMSLSNIYGSNVFSKPNILTSSIIDNISEFSDLYSGSNKLSEFSKNCPVFSIYNVAVIPAIPGLLVPFYDDWIRYTNYGLRNELFYIFYESVVENLTFIISFPNGAQILFTSSTTSFPFPLLDSLSYTVKTPDFLPNFLPNNFFSHYDVFINSSALNLKRKQYDVILSSQGGNFEFDQVFRPPIFSPLQISYMLGAYLNDTTHPFYYDFGGDPNYTSNYYMTINQPLETPWSMRTRITEGVPVIIMRYIMNFIIAEITKIDPTLLLPETVRAIDYINQNNSRLAFMLIDQIFPRVNNTLPHSITNDRFYNLMLLTWNGYEATIITDAVYSFAYGFFAPDLVNQFDFMRNYAELMNFVTISLYNKTNIITSDKVIDIYINNLKYIVNKFPTLINLKNAISNLEKFKQRILISSIDKSSLQDFILEGNSINTTPFYIPVNLNQPTYINLGVTETKISEIIGIIDPLDVDTFGLGPPPIFTGLGAPPFIITFDNLLNNDLLFVSQKSFALREFIVGEQKRNYNNLYKTYLLNFSSLIEKIGLSTGNRMQQHFTSMVNKYNTVVDIYNINDPFIRLEYLQLDNIDYTLFGLLPFIYTFPFIVAPITFDIIYIPSLFSSVSFPDFLELIKREVNDNITNVGIVEEALAFVALYNNYELFNFFSPFNNNSKNYLLIELISFEPLGTKDFFVIQETIKNYYINTMNTINTVVNQYNTTPTSPLIIFLTNYFDFIHNNYYTVEELYLYIRSACISQVTLVGGDVAKCIAFFDSISPSNMAKNLKQIEKDNPSGFRFTHLYILFLIHTLFQNISFLKKTDFNKSFKIDDVVIQYTQILNEFELRAASLKKAKQEILDLFLFRTNNGTNACNNARCAWIKDLGVNMIKNTYVNFSDQKMETLDSDSIHMFHQINNYIGHKRGYDIMIGNIPELTTFDNSIKPSHTLRIPIPFFFTKQPSNYLPLPSMLYQDIKITIELRKLTELLYIDPDSHFAKFLFSKKKKPKSNCITTVKNMPQIEFSLDVEYVYLDHEERLLFAGKPQEYLMEYIAANNDIIIDQNSLPDDKLLAKLFFENPCKYLFWISRTGYSESRNKWTTYGYLSDEYITPETKVYNIPTPFNYTDPKIPISYGNIIKTPIRKNIFSKMLLKYNGQNRLDEQDLDYYKLIQPHYHCRNDIPDGSGVYSYCIDMNNIQQPTGQSNLSRIDDPAMLFTIAEEMRQYILATGDYIRLRIFGNFFNIMRSISGFSSWCFYK